MVRVVQAVVPERTVRAARQQVVRHVQDAPSTVERMLRPAVLYRLGTTPRGATPAVTTVRVNHSARVLHTA